jgi:3-oxoacyl-[acyl-carrier protein] reductase
VHGTRFDSPKSFGEGQSMEQVARDIEADAARETAEEADGTEVMKRSQADSAGRRTWGGSTMPVWGDVTNESEVKRMAGEIRKRFGKIDILVTNAGGDIGAGGTGVGKGGRPDPDDCIEIPLADVQAVLDRNLLSCILCCREVAPEMMARKQGRIITIGSIAGTYGRDEGAIYAVAKAGVHEYTRCLASQLRPHNVTVNCVAPGGTITNRFLVIHKIDQEKLVEAGTLDRYGRPHEVASVVVFLASESAGFISGQVIRVDGASQCWPA